MLKPYQKAELTFDIKSEIGQDGKNSKTYVVIDHQLNAEIVSKQILKSKLNSPAEFFAESQSLYSSSHPNVAQIHYACYDDDHIYIAMPFYKNGSVKKMITGSHLTVRQIITLGSQILSGLHNIHSKGLIHFDIKPDNILLSDQNEALISDFGQAKQMNFSGKAEQDRLYGKTIPPEGIDKDVFDRRFDIYQFGLTLYRMCNGEEHFYKQFEKYGPSDKFDRASFKYDVKNGKFPDRKAFAPHIPSTLRNVIKKCLETDPANRFASAIDVANAMASIDGNCLDWKLNETPNGRVWSKVAGDKEYELTVKDDGNSTCYKSVNGGKKQRVKDNCKDGISERDLRKIFTDY